MRMPFQGLRTLLMVAACVCASTILLAPKTLAQIARGTSSPAANHLPLFPAGDKWRALVIGDAMAAGLLNGLSQVTRGDNRIQIVRPRKVLSSLTRVNLKSELRRLNKVLKTEKIHMAIVMLGLEDRYGFWLSKQRRWRVGSPQWRARYTELADSVVKLLRQNQIAVYWVGLPILRREDWSQSMEGLNAVFRERAISNGARFVDIFSESADVNGRYATRGPDVSGKVVQLRDREGVYFTAAGYRKIAFFVNRALKRDMTQARDERAIPLAGNEQQQRLIRGAASAGNTKAGVGAPGRRRPGAQQDLPKQQRAENVRISFRALASNGKSEPVTLTIVRPALPGSIVNLMKRRYTGKGPSAIGDTVTDTLSNGLMIMRSITPSGSQGASRPTSLSASRQPFFIVLARGERLPPKADRADDFRWPRADDLPPLPVAKGARAPISSPVRLGEPRKRRRKRRN